MNYYEFLLNKKNKVENVGFEINKKDLNNKLFNWQKECISWALKKGKCALFESCGLGKTFQQLEWANQVYKKTNENVLRFSIAIYLERLHIIIQISYSIKV